ncbi:Ig-like domain-containing protein [Sulfidibacter corallicola]|uniref:Ig-like domain-containing protein n=1 Tax=Sulfidibacter corallicola TaxID=2818388 RepID=A0A8A4TQW5_SULCO|nr:Ig-like domain-containing protein [Sulfidibacter corallicola]QTD52369.1 Ig-like domain-containing protein [Sulfidibacter corallicola]
MKMSFRFVSIPFAALLWVTTAPCQDRLFYMVEDRDNARVLLRGTSDQRGIPSGELILGVLTQYRLWLYDPITTQIGTVQFRSGASGSALLIPPVNFRQALTRDTDLDGLHDEGELVVGTSATDPDSDNDGLLDGAELAQGLNPLDGFVAQTGVIASADLDGNAVDISAFDDVAVVALEEQGIAIFNIFNAMAPVLIGSLDTPGKASAVHHSGGNVVAVADGEAGLAVVTMDDPPNAAISHTVTPAELGASPVAVVTSNGLAYVGTSLNVVAVVDMASGLVLRRLDLQNGDIQDLTVVGDFLYVLREGNLHAINISGGGFDQTHVVASPGSVGAGGRRLRLSGGGGLLIASHTRGYNLFSLDDPATPVRIAGGNTAQAGWKHMLANGSGLGVAAVGTNSTDGGPHDLSLYDLSDPLLFDQFLATFQTPGIAEALTLFNGIAYVADGSEGLQVVNYLAFDTGTTPPSVTLTTSPSGTVEEGKPLLLAAAVSDDVQVRNVEFSVDGQRVATDGSFPFEFRLNAPRLATQSSFQVQARVSDTGGNASFSETLTLQVGPDATPPSVVATSPAAGEAIFARDTLAVIFDEPVDLASFDGAWQIFDAGPDGLLDTPDDVMLAPGTVALSELGETAVMTLPGLMPAGLKSARLSTAITDTAGNALTEAFVWHFFVFEERTTGLTAVFYDLPSDPPGFVDSGFAGLTPGNFEVRLAQGSGSVGSFVYPSVNMPVTPFDGDSFFYVGEDGVLEGTSTVEAPAGDDMAVLPPGDLGFYGATFAGRLVVPEAGEVTFTVGVDDAFDLIVNGQTVVEHIGTTSFREFSGAVTLPAGEVSLVLHWANSAFSANLVLSAQGGGLPGGVIGPQFLRPLD